MKVLKNISNTNSLVLGVLLFLVLYAQNSYSQNDWLSGWREATVSIGIVDSAIVKNPNTGKLIIKANGDTLKCAFFKVIGTGLICASPDTNKKIPFLLTAKHIFYDSAKCWFPSSVRFRFSWFSDKSVIEYLGIEIKLKNTNNEILWFPHPDNSVDLSIIPLIISKQAAGKESIIPVRIENFASTNEVFEGANILLFGYPGAVGPRYWTKPIIRSGVIAYVDMNKFGKVPILINAMVFPGNSGGPVFTVPTGMTKNGSFRIGGSSAFLGIVSSVHRQSIELEKTSYYIQSVKSDSLSTHYKTFDFMGLAVIEPSQRVKEILELTK